MASVPRVTICFFENYLVIPIPNISNLKRARKQYIFDKEVLFSLKTFRNYSLYQLCLILFLNAQMRTQTQQLPWGRSPGGCTFCRFAVKRHMHR